MQRSWRGYVAGLGLVTAFFLWGQGITLAQGDPVAENSFATLDVIVPIDVSMLIIPDGSGTPFTDCFTYPGVRVSATILVQVNDADGNPVPNVPNTEIRLEQDDSSMAWCSDSAIGPPDHDPNLADYPTDQNGVTEFSNAYFGGSWEQGPTHVFIREASGDWVPIPMGLEVSYNSPDINGDGVVDLIDVTFFSQDYYGDYHYRSDFNYDGFVNLIDVNFLAEAYGTECP